jgi:predicted flap endonuclease-1-like 5' DNA nuclease
VAAPQAPRPVADNLLRIRGIDPTLRANLTRLGIARYADIASWQPADVARISQSLGFNGRIERENWIEQAQILARGGETEFSRRMDRGEAVTAAATPDVSQSKVVVPPVGAAATPKPAVTSTPAATPAVATQPQVENRAAFAGRPATLTAVPAPAIAPGLAGASASAAAAGTVAPSAVAGRNNLQRIEGINAEVERLLNVQGFSRFAQIAGWTSADATRIDRMLGYDGRVAKERWIEQAKELSQGRDTDYSRGYDARSTAAKAPAAPPPAVAVDPPRLSRLADAIRDTATKSSTEPTPRAGDMSTLRSVRSEAYAPATAGTKRDDLKRIRGVGVLIEKKLGSMGITTYAQIANWSASDIDRVSGVLDFKGRIERENWVEQARILSAGGQTEFSRRVDRGEVETSKNQ